MNGFGENILPGVQAKVSQLTNVLTCLIDDMRQYINKNSLLMFVIVYIIVIDLCS